MKPIAEKIAADAMKEIDSAYKDTALCRAIIKGIVKDLDQELGKVKWLGEDEGWDKAITAVRKELKERYGV